MGWLFNYELFVKNSLNFCYFFNTSSLFSLGAIKISCITLLRVVRQTHFIIRLRTNTEFNGQPLTRGQIIVNQQIHSLWARTSKDQVSFPPINYPNWRSKLHPRKFFHFLIQSRRYSMAHYTIRLVYPGRKLLLRIDTCPMCV